jgi:CheY-like chemotaxis protein
VQNFLSNAIKYTATGKVLLGVRKRKNTVLFQVWDTGPGIDEEQCEKIFSDFYRISGEQAQGVGLGLGVVKRLSQKLAANLQLHSIINHGSCFAITLPRCEPAQIPLTANVMKVGFRNLLVLCIDDKQQNLDALQTLLNKWHIQTRTAQSPEQAIKALDEYVPQVILMDYHLNADLNGLQLIEQIRTKLGKTIPAILITANDTPNLSEQCQQMECGYLSKPVKPAKLRALLQAVQAEVGKQ